MRQRCGNEGGMLLAATVERGQKHDEHPWELGEDCFVCFTLKCDCSAKISSDRFVADHYSVPQR
jgi:hypothetical protein